MLCCLLKYDNQYFEIIYSKVSLNKIKKIKIINFYSIIRLEITKLTHFNISK